MNAQTIRSRMGLILTIFGILMITACTDSSQSDPVVRGERIHAECLSCHGTNLYVSARREIKSLPDLRKEVARWGDYYDPAFSEQDIDDVTAYLNTNFYKF